MVQVKILADLKNDYQSEAQKAVADVKSRTQKPGQFLNWIGFLPKNQIENIDNIYNLAQEAKKDGSNELAILGIGGSRHTTEALINMIGMEDKVHFYSSVDPISFNKFAKKLEGKEDKVKFLVVSKSGGTLETTVAYQNAKELVKTKTPNRKFEEAFVAMTDKNPEKSNLRKLVENGEIKLSGFVHDDVGGRFSIFDDATIFTLAFVGVKKEDTIKMLEASLKAQNEFLNDDVNKNDALKLAVFNVNARQEGKIKHFVEYFGDEFSGTTLWEKQLKNESLKANISTDTNIGPGYLHYNAESDLDKNNKDSFFTFVSVKQQDKYANAVLKGVISAYSNQHPVSTIELDDLSLSSIARFIELKHFETLYTGNILRQLKNDITPSDVALNEVLQPNVEIYKKEVKKALAQ
ncbi:MAG: hypothetical protein BHW64_01515 [Candidatus Melainabacteria bacterium LEY3_CP_29_8]|nr:MAG: hypothetical protein BHW64_01515 [Candidatus Melainabacteria bacterium LEY3_CP_29_8]